MENPDRSAISHLNSAESAHCLSRLVKMDHESTSFSSHELVELCQAIKHKRTSLVRKLLNNKKVSSLNQRIPDDDIFREFAPNLIGDTLLHVAYRERDIDTYRLLLSIGVDFTIANARGSTVVHLIVEEENIKDDGMLKGRLKNSFLAATMFAHYEYRIRQNPRDKRGITHLHAACMANSVDAIIELLSCRDVNVNETVNIDSEFYAGYTPLHFAASYSELCTVETVRILVEHGADVDAVDKDGRTALDLLMERRDWILRLMDEENDFCGKQLLKALVGNEKIVGFLRDFCGAEGSLRKKGSVDKF